MLDNWIKTTLGEVITLHRGYDLPAQNRVFGSVPIISSSGLSDRHVEAKIKGPGVVTGRYGTIGEVFFINEDFWPLNTTLYVADFKGNDPLFVSYLLRTIDFIAHSDKSSVPGVNRNHLHMEPVRIPPLDEQRAIAAMLGALDDKIELNRRMNATLEAMARALFKSWFVDFDPVRAKMEGCIPYGMDPATAALFPAAFTDSPLGPIPAGWQITRIGDLATISREAVNPGAYPDETFDHYSIPAFDGGRLPNAEMGAQIKSNKYLVSSGAILVSKLNPRIPRVWLPNTNATHRSICSTEFIVVSPGQAATRAYLFALFGSPTFLEVFVGRVTGTSSSHQRVKPEDLLDMAAPMPSAALLNRFSDIVTPFYQRIASNLDESCVLATIRDTLLPKLLSGAVRVRDAARVMEAAV